MDTPGKETKRQTKDQRPPGAELCLKVLGDKPVKILILIPPFYLPTYYQYTQTLNIESSLRVLGDKPVHIFICIPPFYLPTYYQYT
jgi:hypothetical protein